MLHVRAKACSASGVALHTDTLCALAAAGSGHLTFIGATNKPNAIDPALRRLGRLDREVAIGLPDDGVRCSVLHRMACHTGSRQAQQWRVLQERMEILELHVQALPLSSDVRMQEVAARCHGYSGADLAAVCREAALHAVSAAILPDGEAASLSEGSGLRGIVSPGNDCWLSVKHDLMCDASYRPKDLMPSIHCSADFDFDEVDQTLKVGMGSFDAAVCKVTPSISRGWHTTLEPGEGPLQETETVCGACLGHPCEMSMLSAQCLGRP